MYWLMTSKRLVPQTQWHGPEKYIKFHMRKLSGAAPPLLTSVTVVGLTWTHDAEATNNFDEIASWF